MANRALLFAASICLAGIADQVVAQPSAPPDSGQLIVSFSGGGDASCIASRLVLKAIGAAKPFSIDYRPCSLFWNDHHDFGDAAEYGAVVVRALPPGDYAIVNFREFYNNGAVEKTWEARHDFSVPFSVRPGRATYIGNFKAISLTGKNVFGLPLPVAEVLLSVADRSARDVPIAASKDPGLGAVDVVIPDVSKAGDPHLVPASAVGGVVAQIDPQGLPANAGVPFADAILGARFRMDGGDGDQAYFGQPMSLKVVREPWFPERLPRGQAYLLLAETGPFAGQYFAITSRQTNSIEEQLARSSFVSVVVHHITRPGPAFQVTNLDDAEAIGMAVIVRYGY